MENKNQNINEITKKKIAEAIKKVSEKYKTTEEVIKKELFDLLADTKLYTDLSLAVLHELNTTAYEIWNLREKYPKRDIILNLEKIVGKEVQKEMELKREFQNFLKEKHIEAIPLPERIEDVGKIPPLKTFPPEIFEDYIVKISKNLDKVSLEVLEVWVPKIIEIMGPPPQIPLGLERTIRLLAPVQIIVEWEAAFHKLRTELEKGK